MESIGVPLAITLLAYLFFVAGWKSHERAMEVAATSVETPRADNRCQWCGEVLNSEPVGQGGCSLCLHVAHREFGSEVPAYVVRGGAGGVV